MRKPSDSSKSATTSSMRCRLTSSTRIMSVATKYLPPRHSPVSTFLSASDKNVPIRKERSDPSLAVLESHHDVGVVIDGRPLTRCPRFRFDPDRIALSLELHPNPRCLQQSPTRDRKRQP